MPRTPGMHPATFSLILFLTVCAVLLGAHYTRRTLAQYWPELFGMAVVVPPQNLAETDSLSSQSAQSEPVDITSLSPEEKVGLLVLAPIELTESGIASGSATPQTVKELSLGGAVLFGSNISASQTAQLTRQLRDSATNSLSDPTTNAAFSHRPIIAVDHEGGSVVRLSGEGFTRLPSWRSLCAQSEASRSALLRQSAGELQQAGITMILGPVVDVAPASSSAVFSRSCSGDPQEVIAAASQAISMYRELKITPVIKHYPGIGRIPTDLHERRATSQITPNDTAPFEQLPATHSGLPIMATHLRVDPLDPTTPCSMSRLCLHEIVRLHPDSLIVADALDMAAANTASSSAQPTSLSQRTIASIGAGAHLILFGPDTTALELAEIKAALLDAYENDINVRSRIDVSLKKIAPLLEEK